APALVELELDAPIETVDAVTIEIDIKPDGDPEPLLKRDSRRGVVEVRKRAAACIKAQIERPVQRLRVCIEHDDPCLPGGGRWDERHGIELVLTADEVEAVHR